MDWLEEELRKALARREPSPDFAVRVRRAARPRPVFAPRRWLGAAAALVVIAGGAAGYREHQGRVAKEKVLLAMRIASGKLNHIQEHVKGMSQ